MTHQALLKGSRNCPMVCLRHARRFVVNGPVVSGRNKRSRPRSYAAAQDRRTFGWLPRLAMRCSKHCRHGARFPHPPQRRARHARLFTRTATPNKPSAGIPVFAAGKYFVTFVGTRLFDRPSRRSEKRNDGFRGSGTRRRARFPGGSGPSSRA